MRTDCYEDIPRGPLKALSRSIQIVTLPGPFTEAMLSGKPKTLISLWCGDLDKDEESYSSARGDGTTILSQPGDPLYCLPAGRFTGHPGFDPSPNIRAGIPIWLLNSTSMLQLDDPTKVKVIAVGNVHPLFNTATMDVYRDGQWQCRRYCYDVRLNRSEVINLDVEQQFDQIEEMGGDLGPTCSVAPSWAPGGRSVFPMPNPAIEEPPPLQIPGFIRALLERLE